MYYYKIKQGKNKLPLIFENDKLSYNINNYLIWDMVLIRDSEDSALENIKYNNDDNLAILGLKNEHYCIRVMSFLNMNNIYLELEADEIKSC